MLINENDGMKQTVKNTLSWDSVTTNCVCVYFFFSVNGCLVMIIPKSTVIPVDVSTLTVMYVEVRILEPWKSLHQVYYIKIHQLWY